MILKGRTGRKGQTVKLGEDDLIDLLIRSAATEGRGQLVISLCISGSGLDY